MDKKEQLEKLMQNPAFVAETQNVNSIDDLIALYNKYGVEITADDMAGMSKVFGMAKKTEETKAKYAPKEKNKKKDNTKALIAILVVGLIIFLIGVPKNIKCTELQNAVVVAVDEKIQNSRTDGLNHRTTIYRPVIEYEVNGEVYDGQWDTWTSFRAYHEEENVKIRYNPNNPAEFVVNEKGGFTYANLLGLIVAAFAGICLIRKKLISR